MDDRLVSVVVPTYNRAYCICRAIDSVRAQTHRQWEVVLVDDGSTDDTAALLKSKYGDDPRIRYLYQANAGVTVARNTAIHACRGDYVAFLDSDDVWQPWKLETQLACFHFFPQVGMVWTNFAAVDVAGHTVHPRYLTTMYGAYRFFPSFDDLFAQSHRLSQIVTPGHDVLADARVYVGNIYVPMLRGNLAHTSTVMLSRERLATVQQFDESLTLSGEDYDFHFRTCKGGDVCFIDVPSTLYRVGADDNLSRHSIKTAQNFLRTVQGAIARESSSGTFPRGMIREVLADAHSWMAEELYKIEDDAGARNHALLSLRRMPWQPRLLGLLSLALMPRRIARPLLQAYRRRHVLRLGRKRPDTASQ